MTIELQRWKRYKKEYDYSFSFGGFPTIELLKNRPEQAAAIYYHSTCRDISGLEELCGGQIPLIRDDKIFDRLSASKSERVMGVFHKYAGELDGIRPHIVLVNPGDMGNLGTILRNVLGMNYHDVALIAPATDWFHPKAVRASMGAVFHLNIRQFENFEEYQTNYPGHELFPFMLGGEIPLTFGSCPSAERFSLVFGNEATGLPESFRKVGTPIRIPQTGEVDSLNLAVAASLGAYVFALKNGLLQEVLNE